MDKSSMQSFGYRMSFPISGIFMKIKAVKNGPDGYTYWLKTSERGKPSSSLVAAKFAMLLGLTLGTGSTGTRYLSTHIATWSGEMATEMIEAAERHAEGLSVFEVAEDAEPSCDAELPSDVVALP